MLHTLRLLTTTLPVLLTLAAHAAPPADPPDGAESPQPAATADPRVHAEPPETSESPKAALFAKGADTRQADDSTVTRPLAALDRVLRPATFGSSYIAVSGYLQPSFVFTRDTDAFAANAYDGFTIPSARLAFKAKYPLSEAFSVGLSAQINLGSSGVKTVDAYGTFGLFDDKLQIDVGQQRVAFSLYRQVSASLAQLARPVGDQPDAFVFRSRREPGLRIRAELPFAAAGLLRWYASVTNGDGTNHFKNTDSKFFFSTFLDVAPIGDPGWAATDLDHSPFTFSFGASAGYNQSVGPDNPEFLPDGPEVRFAAHGRLKARGFSLRGEYYHLRQSPPDEAVGRFQGGMVQAGYVLPWLDFPQLELVARYHRLDLDDRANGFEGLTGPPFDRAQLDTLRFDRMSAQIFEVGFNLYVLDHRAKLGVVYRRTDILDADYESVRDDGAGGFVRVREAFPDRVIGDRVFVTAQFGAF